VVTADILLYQIFGPANLMLVNLAALNNCKSIDILDKLITQNDVYYVEKDEYFNKINQKRWAEQLNYLNGKKGTLIFCGDNGYLKWRIYKLRNQF
jgi:hypothetical protein